MTKSYSLPEDFQWAALVPEFLVTSIERSFDFWCRHLGFHVAYERPEDGFAYLNLGSTQVMLLQRDEGARNWLTGPLEAPLGRGVNFQIQVADLTAILGSLGAAAWPLFMSVEEAWYRVADQERGQKQFLVQDPDGYLLRLFEDLGLRPIEHGQLDSEGHFEIIEGVRR